MKNVRYKTSLFELKSVGDLLPHQVKIQFAVAACRSRAFTLN